MAPPDSSEMSVHMHQTAWCHIPENPGLLFYAVFVKTTGGKFSNSRGNTDSKSSFLTCKLHRSKIWFLSYTGVKLAHIYHTGHLILSDKHCSPPPATIMLLMSLVSWAGYVNIISKSMYENNVSKILCVYIPGTYFHNTYKMTYPIKWLLHQGIWLTQHRTNGDKNLLQYK